ncbi:MAG TPA: peptidylprolyl isomerase [Xanthomonadaceae bacterium]|nr:peptidylprolyl isomerase [Xanthomonadaceae bacterium]
MQVAKDTVVRFHYSVAESAGQAIEDSRDRGDPIAILVGHRNIVAGLEQALIGRAAGERFAVVVAAADAYGERSSPALQRVPKKYFREPARLRPGMGTVLQTAHGPRMVTVVKVGMSVVDIDLNHPMAGKDLEFDVEILEVRAASAEELEHGHAHGSGGQQH